MVTIHLLKLSNAHHQRRMRMSWYHDFPWIEFLEKYKNNMMNIRCIKRFFSFACNIKFSIECRIIEYPYTFLSTYQWCMYTTSYLFCSIGYFVGHIANISPIRNYVEIRIWSKGLIYFGVDNWWHHIHNNSQLIRKMSLVSCA